MNRFCSVPVASAESQLPIRTRCSLELFKSFNQSHVVFAWMLQTGNVQEKGLSQVILLRHGCLCHGNIAGKESLVVQSVVNDGNSLAWQPEVMSYVTRCGFAYRNNFMLSPGETPRDDPAVKHA